MKNWQGRIDNIEEPPQTAAKSLPVGSGVFTFIKLNIGGKVAYSASEDSEQQLSVRFA